MVMVIKHIVYFCLVVFLFLPFLFFICLLVLHHNNATHDTRHKHPTHQNK